jgi:hypothetical protein
MKHDYRAAAADALDLLEQKELPSGGWPADRRYYKVGSKVELRADHVDLGWYD